MTSRAALGVAVAGTMAIAGAGGVVAARFSRDDTQKGPAAVVQGPTSPFEGSRMPEGVRAPDFRLRDEHWRPISMHELRGKPVVVTFL